FEVGLSLYYQQLKKAGKKPPAPGSVQVNEGSKFDPEVKAAYARARRHDPFQINAYQGDERAVIDGFLALGRRGLPACGRLARDWSKPAPDEVLTSLAGACQEAGVHELALVARQVLIARHGRYLPEDHPFISAGLKALAPGKATEQTLADLAGGKLAV